MKKIILIVLVILSVFTGMRNFVAQFAREKYERYLADSIRKSDSTLSVNADKFLSEQVSTPTDIVKTTDRKKYHITYMMKDVIYQNDSVILIKK